MAKNARSAAILTIFEPNRMTPVGRTEIAKWLRAQARMLLAHGGQMASRYTARYLYARRGA